MDKNKNILIYTFSAILFTYLLIYRPIKKQRIKETGDISFCNIINTGSNTTLEYRTDRGLYFRKKRSRPYRYLCVGEKYNIAISKDDIGDIWVFWDKPIFDKKEYFKIKPIEVSSHFRWRGNNAIFFKYQVHGETIKRYQLAPDNFIFDLNLNDYIIYVNRDNNKIAYIEMIE
ncbi:hypothetical protein [Flammeovirga sp. EKP202]|uniref:hypothetical protein n=1 Tax=Flammeovirga sp. EKP202 TaxID=2770592 RepID=UPI00165F2890|nr:hypothetical protein [Flammeovirga sp. EKP202]MBD0402863.1 hypothetical protein [Flammeovirga sp. EKP202]